MDLKAGPYQIAGMLRSHAVSQAKQRIKRREYKPFEEYDHQLIRETQS